MNDKPHWRRALLALATISALIFIASLVFKHYRSYQVDSLGENETFAPSKPTLVVYVLDDTDDTRLENFYYFYYEAILRDSWASYDIIVSGHGKNTLLPDLPSHARYVRDASGCRGLALVQRHLQSRLVLQYDCVILASSAVRGPFIPPSLRAFAAWHSVLCADLDARTALTGSVVSCVQPLGRRHSEKLRPPFVEFTAMAASRAGIEQLLQLPGSSLPGCSSQADDSSEGQRGGVAAVLAQDRLTAAEVEAMEALRAWSGAVLDAGLGLASLAARQRGVDWSDQQTWTCNKGLSPVCEYANDGQSLGPYEAMFVPVGSYDDIDMPSGTSAEFARTYAEWLLADVENISDVPVLPSNGGLRGVYPQRLRSDLVGRNRYYGMGHVYKLPAVLLAVALGEQCFDAEYFRMANPDLAILPPHDAWKYFVFIAQFQPRPFRLKCGLDWNKFGLRSASGGSSRSAGGHKQRSKKT